jgi:alkaline phosphatase D
MTGFTHNVASGEPAADSVLLWTRFKPKSGGDARLRAEVSETACLLPASFPAARW